MSKYNLDKTNPEYWKELREMEDDDDIVETQPKKPVKISDFKHLKFRQHEILDLTKIEAKIKHYPRGPYKNDWYNIKFYAIAVENAFVEIEQAFNNVFVTKKDTKIDLNKIKPLIDILIQREEKLITELETRSIETKMKELKSVRQTVNLAQKTWVMYNMLKNANIIQHQIDFKDKLLKNNQTQDLNKLIKYYRGAKIIKGYFNEQLKSKNLLAGSVSSLYGSLSAKDCLDELLTSINCFKTSDYDNINNQIDKKITLNPEKKEIYVNLIKFYKNYDFFKYIVEASSILKEKLDYYKKLYDYNIHTKDSTIDFKYYATIYNKLLKTIMRDKDLEIIGGHLEAHICNCYTDLQFACKSININLTTLT